MASPIRLYVIPDCGLDIEIVDQDRFLSLTDDVNDSCSLWKYRVKHDNQFQLLSKNVEGTTLDSCYEGFMSPTHEVTLPKAIKKKAGIPEEACRYAYMHPPCKLGEKIDWQFFARNTNKEFADRLEDDDFQDSPDSIAPSVDVNYMNLQNDWAVPLTALLGAFVYFDERNNIISVNALSSEATKVKKVLKLSGPFHPNDTVTQELQALNRVVVSKLALFHEAGFESYCWLRPHEKFQANSISEEHTHCHGSFVFFRYDGSAISYAVDSSGYADPKNGDTEMLADIFQSSFMSVQNIDASSFQEVLNCFPSDGQEKVHGWNSLHMACSRKDDLGLLGQLVDRFPGALLQSDRYGRLPIHLLCDNQHVTIESLDEILRRDPLGDTVHVRSKNLGMLPLHFALSRGAPSEVIRRLIEVDKKKTTIRCLSKCGRLPLHFAIEQRVEPAVIELLLNADENLGYDNEEALGVYQRYNGMIPLHIAAWNNSSIETVKLLLSKDILNHTIDYGVGAGSWTYQYSFDDLAVRRLSSSKRNEEECMTALHLAIYNENTDVTLLLLQKEKERDRAINDITTIDKLDLHGRTCLHVACQKDLDVNVIQLLLDLDPFKRSTTIADGQGFKPLHYACENKHIQPGVIELLLDAEEEYFSSEYDKIPMIPAKTNPVKTKRSTHSVDERKRSPLYLAVKSRVNPEVIKILLRPEHFYLKGLDNATLDDLASMISGDETLQKHIIEKLSERMYFNLLVLEFYANLTALITFLIGSERLLNGTITTIEPSILAACVVIFLIRECIQMKSQTTQYFADLWSWIQLSSAGFTINAIRHMFLEVGTEDPAEDRNLLIISGGLLIIQFTIFLRSTFLPFATFVGGLLTIFTKLVPFFIVSALLLLAFAYGFRMSADEEVKQCSHLGECYLWVLQGFFSGTEETTNILEILFGIVVIIVLLNVVIAIVDEAWSDATDNATDMFWSFRLSFLSETRFLTTIHKKLSFGRSKGILASMIDNVRDLSFANSVSWSKEPYNVCMTKEQYDEPYEFFPSSLAKQIDEAHSLQADLYWTEFQMKKKNAKDGNHTKRRVPLFQIYLVNIMVIGKWLVSCITYLVLFVLGVFTCGWFWPRNLRTKVLSVGLQYP